MHLRHILTVVWIVCGHAIWMSSSAENVNCSFSDQDWCGYRNAFENQSVPEWELYMAPAEGDGQIQSIWNPSGRYDNLRFTRRGNFPMEWPPHGKFYISTGPTEEESNHGIFAEIESPEVHVTNGSKCLYFSYHNRLPFKLIPTLEVRIRVENSSDQVIASYLALDSTKWFEAQVRLPVGEYRIVFAGKNYYKMFNDGGEVAVTNIAVLDGNCARSIPEWMERPGDCGFENGLGACGYAYTNDSSMEFLEFQTESLKPPENHLAPKDRFLAITGKYHQITSHDSKSRIRSPEIFIEKEGCLYLWYFNSVKASSDDANALNVLIQTEETKEPDVLFRLPISKNFRDRWYQLSGALPEGRLRLILEAIYTRDFGLDDYVGFDNVEVFNRSCLELENMKDACTIAQTSGRNLCKDAAATCSGTGKKSFQCKCPNNNYYGDRCQFSYPCSTQPNPCLNGGTCSVVGRVNLTCKCSRGFIGDRCQDRKKCGSPASVLRNSIVSFVNDSYQSVARFECLPGFIAQGEMTAVCLDVGEWQANGKCHAVNCDSPPYSINYATLLEVSNHTWYGKARYNCQSGYMFLSEMESILECRPIVNVYRGDRYYYKHQQQQYSPYSIVNDAIVGGWFSLSNGQQNSLACQVIPNCGPAPNVINSVLESVTDTYFNGLASYRCLDGYQVNVRENGSYKHVFTLKCVNSWTPAAGQVMYECWAIPDCGQPSNITNGRIENGTRSTGINSTVVYRCNTGYRMIGVETAICWRFSSDPRRKWVEWQFVPSCEKSCAAKVGRPGNVSSVVLQITRCFVSLNSKEPDCIQPVDFSIRNMHRGRKASNDDKESVTFYGRDVCIGERVTRVLRTKDETTQTFTTVSNTTRCKSFCLQQPSDIYYLTVYEEFFYKSSLQQYQQQPFSNYAAGTSSIRREFLKYTVRLFV